MPLRCSGLPQGARAKGEEEQSPRCTVWQKKKKSKSKSKRYKGFIQALSLSGSLTQSSWSLRPSQARHASTEQLHFWVLLLVTLRQGHPLDPPRERKRLTHLPAMLESRTRRSVAAAPVLSHFISQITGSGLGRHARTQAPANPRMCWVPG